MEVEFVYQFPWKGKLRELKLPLQLPYEGDIEELSSRLVKVHGIPYHLEDDLTRDLARFVSRETSKHQDACCDHVIKTALQDEEVLSERIQNMVKQYTERCVEFTNLKEAEEDKFPAIYHNLIHSSELNTLLQLEHTYAVAVRDMLKARENALGVLQKKHDDELSKAMKELGVYTSDYDINQLMKRHVSERESLEEKWLAETSSLQESQKREYRDWLTQMNEEMVQGNASKDRKRLSSHIRSTAQITPEIEDTVPPKMEESFTIHLGAQEKSSHNLRLLCRDLLSFCQHAEGEGSLEETQLKLNPQRIESAMSLYTTNLSAIILTVDTEVNTVMGTKEVFANSCRQSTDFHFPSIDDQLARIRQYSITLNEDRMLGADDEDSYNPTPSSGSRRQSRGATPDRSRESSLERSLSLYESSPTDPGMLHASWSHDSYRQGSTRSPSPNGADEEQGVKLKPGDFYLTRHSNLSQVHVVCHLVSEEHSLLDPSLRARDPTMQGLRNSLRTIAKHGIRHITLPLLLTRQMKPDMTINWCLKRAELVFKSVKGFLLESTTWSGSNESWNMQFLIPENISVDLFEQISDLLSKTFRKSVTLTLK